MCDRHEKWVRAEPGTMIPAGQPYRQEWEHDKGIQSQEWISSVPCEAHKSEGCDWFVDSSWKPPLVLPTEWTWAIVVHTGSVHPEVGRWKLNGGRLYRHTFADPYNVLDFIPLTDEQVARIEQAR